MVWIFALLFAVVRIESASVASCGDQYGCLKVDVSEPTDDDQYEICLYWDSTLATCDKSGAISHACSSQDDDDKIENFQSGRDSAMCNVVDCGDNAIFGLKDGKGCGSSSGWFGFSGVSGIYCQGSGENGYCGGGNTKECMWVVPAPECGTTTSTITTEEPYRTASTSTTKSVPSDEMTTTADDDEAETTTTTESATTTATEAAPMTTVDCEVYDEGCNEYDNADLCEVLNPMDVACRWNEDGVIAQCVLDVAMSCCVACGCRYEEAVGCYPDPTDSVRIRQDVYDVSHDVSDAQIDNGMDDAAKPAVSQWVYVAVAAGAAILLGVLVAAAICVWKKTSKHGFHATNVNEPDADAENAIANEGLEHELDVEDQLIIDTAQSAETS